MEDMKKLIENEKGAKLAALNAAIPHINFDYQKKLAVMVKMMEIKEICRYYDSADKSKKIPQNPNWRQNLINAVLPHLNEGKQQSLQSMVQIIEMQEAVASLEVQKN